VHEEDFQTDEISSTDTNTSDSLAAPCNRDKLVGCKTSLPRLK